MCSMEFYAPQVGRNISYLQVDTEWTDVYIIYKKPSF